MNEHAKPEPVHAECTFADFRGTSVIHTAANASSTLVQTLLINNAVTEGVLTGTSGTAGQGATVAVERYPICAMLMSIIVSVLLHLTETSCSLEFVFTHQAHSLWGWRYS